MTAYHAISDEELMCCYQRGDYAAFEQLYFRCQGHVNAWLRRRLQDDRVREDVFQNVFIKLHKTRARYDSSYPVLAWLYVICRCELRDYLKKPAPHCVALRDEHALAEPQHEDIYFDLDGEKRLTTDEKMVLKLKYFSEQDYRSIAARLGRSEVGVRKIGSRGLQKLRLKYRPARL